MWSSFAECDAMLIYSLTGGSEALVCSLSVWYLTLSCILSLGYLMLSVVRMSTDVADS